MRSALLYQTHIWSSEIEAQFDQLSSLDGISTWILLDSRTPTADMLVRRYSRCYVFDLERLFGIQGAGIRSLPRLHPLITTLSRHISEDSPTSRAGVGGRRSGIQVRR